MLETIITAALAALSLATGEPDMSGYASRYDEGVMQSVLQVRLEKGYGRVPEDWATGYDGYVAVLDCSTVGDVVYARPGEGYPYERFLISDCAGDWPTVEWMTDNAIIVELDYESFMRWKAAGFYTGRGLTVEIVEVGG